MAPYKVLMPYISYYFYTQQCLEDTHTSVLRRSGVGRYEVLGTETRLPACFVYTQPVKLSFWALFCFVFDLLKYSHNDNIFRCSEGKNSSLVVYKITSHSPFPIFCQGLLWWLHINVRFQSFGCLSRFCECSSHIKLFLIFLLLTFSLTYSCNVCHHLYHLRS